MSVFLIVLIVLLIFLPVLRHPRLHGGRPRSPIEPGGQSRALPPNHPMGAKSDLPTEQARAEPQPPANPEQALIDDYAEGRISVEEYERRLDALYRGGTDNR